MSYKTFVNGFPLNASELNEYLMSQVISVFVDATARDAAIESPTEGQFSYLTGSNVLTFFNGTAWANYGLAPLTANRAIASNGSGELTASTVTATELGYLSGVTSSIQTQINAIPSPGMVKVASQSFTSSTAVNVNNVFTSTYQNYQVVVSLNASGATNLLMRMRASGADFATGNKYFSAAYNSLWGDFNSSETNQWQVGYGELASGIGLTMELYRPQVSTNDTSITFNQVGGRSGSYVYAPFTGAAGIRENRGFDGFTLYPSSGNITGTVRVYGMVN
jgi:hypothetical protein